MEPLKNIHSHPGDAIAYGAARLFPGGKFVVPEITKEAKVGHYFGENWHSEAGVWRPEDHRGEENPHQINKGPAKLPQHGEAPPRRY